MSLRMRPGPVQPVFLGYIDSAKDSEAEELNLNEPSETEVEETD